jgi:hypothetical protein
MNLPGNAILQNGGLKDGKNANLRSGGWEHGKSANQELGGPGLSGGGVEGLAFG